MTLRRLGLGRRPLIMLLLGLLVALFLGGMWLMSNLNLRFAESALSTLRGRQIVETFHANLDRIDAHHRRMEQNSRDLARIGRLLSEMGAGPEGVAGVLEQVLEEFPDARGATLRLTQGALPLALYASRQGAAVSVEPLEAGWQQADWWRRRQVEWRESPHELHWTAAYFKSRIDDAVISVSAPVHDETGRLLGMASSDWVASDIIGLVSGVEVTPRTFAFLIDRENRNLSSLARAEDLSRSQRLIEAVSALELHREAQAVAGEAEMQRRELEMAGETWSLYHAATRAGMVFGIGVPRAEIDAVLSPMRQVNLRILALLGLGLLALAGVVLFLVAGLLRQLRTLYTDPLTGLPNRARLLADLGDECVGSLLLVNLDGFKQFNDLFGHRCGDQVIRRMAELLRDALGGAEWRGSRLYRMPGDEHAIWLPGTYREAQLEARLAGLQRALGGARLHWRGQELPLQMSLGLASSWQLDVEGDDDETLLASASIALKQARAALRDHAIYDPEARVREDYERNLAWANRLAAALDDGRVVAHFQPILDLGRDRVDRFECLVRMLDEEGEAIGPGAFLEVARRSRLYRRLTLTMVERCLAALDGGDHALSLNLSGEDILDPGISEPLLARLAESGLGHRLIFEILESEGIENYAAVGAFIARAKALGVRIAIDDFGSGYSNFEHLLRLDVDLLKIDGSLVRDLDRDPQALTLTRGIVRFARELGIATVAEFVHSPEVLARVRELGIDYAQGACIGMPAPRPVVEAAPT